jgi:hypothetical protein
MFLRSTSFGRLNKREDLCYASLLIRIFGPQGHYPLNPSRIRYHQPLNIYCEVQQFHAIGGGLLFATRKNRCAYARLFSFKRGNPFAPFLHLALPFLVLDPFFLRTGRRFSSQPPLLFFKPLF